MPHWPEFLVGGTYTPVSYRADVEQTINLYPERVESQGGSNTGFLRRRPALMLFAGQTAGGTTTGSISYAMVGAGGWYGAGISVGGGGGGSAKRGTLSMTVGTYPVVIGQAAAASAGGDSTFNGITALGGGVGGDDTNPGTGGNGGNGGGAATSYFDGVSTWTPFSGGVGSDGFNGGNSAINSGAGGGGAGSAGANATQNNGGAGGDGVTVTIPGGSLVLGPGGAGVGLTTRGAFTTGDYGSGGSQEDYTGPDPAVDAQDGVVVLWYQTGDFTATGGTITTSGDYTIHTFTADATFAITSVVPTVITAASGGAIHYCPAQGRCFVVSNSGAFQEVFADGSLQTFGAVTVGPYRPTMADNGTGDQLLVVSGYQAWIFDLSTNALTRVTDGDLIENVVLCAFSDGYFLVLNTRGVLQWSAPLDGTAWDALDIAKNSATSDPWVSLLVNHRELWLVGTATGQVWVNTGNADQPFELVQGSVFHQGLIAPFTLQRCDNSSFWVGQNEQGRCIVFRASGYTPTRISNHAIEVALGSSSQLENAIASVFQSQGHTFYAIYVPDLQFTYVYDASTEKWCSWGQLVSDASDPWTWEPWPVQGSTFAFGKNLVVGPSTVLISWLRWDDEEGPVTPTRYLFVAWWQQVDPDTGDMEIQLKRYNADTGALVDTIWTLSQPPGYAPVSGMAYNAATGLLYVPATDGTAKCYSMAADGTGLTSFALDPALDVLSFVAVDDAGNSYFLSYNASQTAINTVRGYDTAGAIIGEWIPDPTITDSSRSLGNIAVSADGSTLSYLILSTTAPYGDNVIYQYDLVGDAPLPNVYEGDTPNPPTVPAIGTLTWWLERAGYAVGFYGAPDPVVDADYHFGRVNASAVLSWTTADGNVASQARGDYWWTLESSAWVRRITEGSVVRETNTVAYPLDANTFGAGWLVTGTGAPPNPYGPTAEPAIRWVRRCPHIINELKRTFYRRFELSMDVGQGDTANPSPVIYLRYSNDGAQTWSTPQAARYGVTGQWNTRVFWAPLGSARDRVFEVYGDASAPLRMVDAFLTLDGGLH